jgi:signal transduction histidine kinase
MLSEARASGEHCSDVEESHHGRGIFAVDLALAEERERRRISRCLHDRVGNKLALAMLNAHRLRRTGGLDEEAQRMLDSLCKELEGAIAATRGLSFELASPVLYEIGFTAALESLADRLASGPGLQVQIDCDPLVERVPKNTAIILYRIAEELLLNVTKHARATSVEVTAIVADDELTLAVRDDGRGIAPQGGRFVERDGGGGLGLAAIRERVARLGGRFDIAAPRVAGGTTATIRLPVGLTDTSVP